MKLSIIVIFLLVFSSLTSKEYVSARLWGQLGNQLFIVSNALAMAWENNATPVFPCLETETIRNIPLNRKKIFFRLNAKLPEEIKLKEKHYSSHHFSPIKYEPNILLVGYSLSLDYFQKYEKQLQEIFSPSKETREYLQTKYGSYLKYPECVGVQIRICALDVYPFCGWKYFEDAMDQFSKEAIFLVSSDRIDWVKKHFPKTTRKVVFVEGNDHIDDFFLLTKCKHNIISNSTFGYWAAYLNKNPKKIVIAPNLWHAHSHKLTRIGFPAKQNIYPKNWKVLRVPLYRKIADGISQYSTTSVEGG